MAIIDKPRRGGIRICILTLLMLFADIVIIERLIELLELKLKTADLYRALFRIKRVPRAQPSMREVLAKPRDSSLPALCFLSLSHQGYRILQCRRRFANPTVKPLKAIF